MINNGNTTECRVLTNTGLLFNPVILKIRIKFTKDILEIFLCSSPPSVATNPSSTGSSVGGMVNLIICPTTDPDVVERLLYFFGPE